MAAAAAAPNDNDDFDRDREERRRRRCGRRSWREWEELRAIRKIEIRNYLLQIILILNARVLRKKKNSAQRIRQPWQTVCGDVPVRGMKLNRFFCVVVVVSFGTWNYSTIRSPVAFCIFPGRPSSAQFETIKRLIWLAFCASSRPIRCANRKWCDYGTAKLQILNRSTSLLSVQRCVPGMHCSAGRHHSVEHACCINAFGAHQIENVSYPKSKCVGLLAKNGLYVAVAT